MLRNFLFLIVFPLSCAIFAASGSAEDNAGRYIEEYTRAIEQNPNNADAYRNRADMFKFKGEHDRAIADYTRAIELNPKDVMAFNNRAVAFAKKREYDQALADYSRVIELDPRNETPYSNRGGLYADMGEYDKAIADLNRAVELNPKHDGSYYNRGLTFYWMGEYDLALADYNRAIERSPKFTSAYRPRGTIYFDKGDFAKASADFLRASQRRQDDVYTFIFRYLALARQGENPAAELELNAGRLKSGAWPSPVVELYLGKRQPDALLAAAADADERCEAHFFIGQWEILHSKPAQAEAALRKAVETCPKKTIEYKSAEAELWKKPGALSVVGVPVVTAKDLDALDPQAVQLYREGKYREAVEALNQRIIQLHREGKYLEATAIAEKAFALAERMLGPEHPATLPLLSNLANLYQEQGRYGEAEPLYKRALGANERLDEDPNAFLSINKVGAEHAGTLVLVNNLGELYRAQGRDAEAEPLLKRGLAGRESVLGPEHADTLRSVNNLAALYQAQGKHAEAEALYKRALEAKKRTLGAEHADTLRTINNLATLHEAQGRHGEAETLYKSAIEGAERTLGPDHPNTLRGVGNLALLYQKQARFGEAERLNQRALAGYERALGPEHPDTLISVNNLAGQYFVQRDWPRAAAMWRRSTAAIAARTQRDASGLDQALTGARKSEAEQLDWQFWHLVKTVYRLAPAGDAPEATTSRAMFETAQWALSSEVARSLAQMATRGAKGDGALAALIRARQDLVAEWQKGERVRSASLGQEAAKRDAAAEAQNTGRMATIDAQVAEIDKTLAAQFPDYADLAGPAPISVAQVQRHLGTDEALVLFLDTPESKPTAEETFIWVVTKTAMRWARSDLGGKALAREVQALRCGLDSAAWEGPRCKELTGVDYTQADYVAGKPLPFDHKRAYGLYRALFGAVEDLIEGKHLLLVPSGPLTQLPFQVLTTAPSTRADHRSAAWLARSHALTVLPAVSSLKALRATSRPSRAERPLIGFGNPLLDGSDEGDSARAQVAREKQSCPKTPWQRAAAIFGLGGGTHALQTRGGRAEVSLIRKQTPLPETADELCAVARDMGVDGDQMRLGARATERTVKAMSAGGELAKYRIVYFATHGAMAGELDGSAEPGLIMTPPAIADEEDDGYLSASEIVGLKLNADWVILSACNTAAGDAASAQALSGLARAFIYAHARALLVSHWAVYSDATVKLTTTAIGEMTRDNSVGRAEALRRAMLALVDAGEPREAHPAYWAPLVVVGEGAR